MMVYAKLGGILVVVIAIFAVGYHFGGMPYKMKYEALQAENWKEKAEAEIAAKVVVTGQLMALQTQAKVNADAMQNLATQNAQITRDRDVNVALARRLLNSQARSTSTGCAVPKTADQPAAAAAGGARQDDSLAQLVADVADECTRNADRLDALIAQISPQL